MKKQVALTLLGLATLILAFFNPWILLYAAIGALIGHWRFTVRGAKSLFRLLPVLPSLLAWALTAALAVILPVGIVLLLLSAILLPTMPRSRENARIVGCKSNLKEIAIAIRMYALDYDDSLPPLDKWDVRVNKHVKGSLRFECPADFRPSPVLSYGLSPVLGGANISNIDSPNKTPLIFDAEDGHPKPRHAGQFNVVYADDSSGVQSQAPSAQYTLQLPSHLATEIYLAGVQRELSETVTIDCTPLENYYELLLTSEEIAQLKRNRLDTSLIKRLLKRLMGPDWRIKEWGLSDNKLLIKTVTLTRKRPFVVAPGKWYHTVWQYTYTAPSTLLRAIALQPDANTRVRFFLPAYAFHDSFPHPDRPVQREWHPPFGKVDTISVPLDQSTLDLIDSGSGSGENGKSALEPSVAISYFRPLPRLFLYPTFSWVFNLALWKPMLWGTGVLFALVAADFREKLLNPLYARTVSRLSRLRRNKKTEPGKFQFYRTYAFGTNLVLLSPR